MKKCHEDTVLTQQKVMENLKGDIAVLKNSNNDKYNEGLELSENIQ